MPDTTRRFDVESAMWLVRLDTLVCVLVVTALVVVLVAQVVLGVPLAEWLDAHREARRHDARRAPNERRAER